MTKKKKAKKVLFNKTETFKKGSVKSDQVFHAVDSKIKQLSLEESIISSEEEQTTEDKIGEAHQEVAKQKTVKKKVTNALFFCLNLIIVGSILINQVLTSKVDAFDTIIQKGLFRWQFVFVILGAFALVMFLETFRVSVLIKESTKKMHMVLSYKMNSMGKYWDCITPMSTGGQPFQIFYLNKRGIDSGTAISIPIARYIILQIALLIVGIFATVYSTNNYGETNLVSVASYVGFVLNTIMLVGTWFLSVSKKTGKILVAKSLKLLYKMHILKNYEKVYEKVMVTVNNFQTTMTVYTKNIFKFLGLVFTNLFQLVVNYSIPYFIYLMLGGSDPSMWLNITVYSILIDLASGFVPLPGGSGMSEVAFTIVFAGIFPEGTVFWGLLLWRFMNYYIYIVQGIIIMIYDYLVGNKKLEWQKKKWELENESNKFKLNQLKKSSKKNKNNKIRI